MEYIMELIIICLFISIVYKQTQFIKDNKKIEEEIKMVQNNCEKVREFKHDYKNIISTLLGYIEEENMEELKNYFYHNILNDHEELEEIPAVIDVYKIKVLSIRGTLLSEIYKARRNKITINIKINKNIDCIYINEKVFCKCLAIVMDNAIEAARYTDRVVNLIFEKDKNFIEVIVINKFNNNIVKRNLFNRGYSTKGEDRGLGLYNVRKQLGRIPNIAVNTEVEKNIFKQQFYIEINEESRMKGVC